MAWRLWKPKNLSDTIFPFTTLSALMGFGVFQYPIGRPRMLISVVYSIVLSVILWSIFVMSFLETYNRNGTQANRNALFFLSYLNQTTTLLAQISCFWYTKKQLRILHRLMTVDSTLNKLGASFDYQQCLFVGILSFVCWFSLFLGNAISRISWLTDPMPLGQAILLVVVTKYPAVIHMFVGLTFWILAWYTGHKFYAVNKLLDEPYKHLYRRFESDDFGTLLQKIFHITSFDSSLCERLKNDTDRKDFIQIMKHVHLEITLVTKDLSDINGGLMLVQFGMDFAQFTTFSYVLYGVWVRPQVEFKWIRIYVALFWMAAFLLKIFLINGICASVTNEAKRTGNRIHHFVHSEGNSELFDEVKQFGFQLRNVPVLFSPVGFFRLGDQFVKGFFGTVLTYLIIMIQMDEEDNYL